MGGVKESPAAVAKLELCEDRVDSLLRSAGRRPFSVTLKSASIGLEEFRLGEVGVVPRRENDCR